MNVSPNDRASAYAAFLQNYPLYAATSELDDLRVREYARLDETGQVYLDYTGGGQYADAQLRAHVELLRRNVFGNPHSNNPTSLAMTELVEQARAYVLEYFNAPPDEYLAIFTPNASGALKIVGESYPFGPDANYLLTYDNHNSVNGIREYAWRKGATVTYVPVVQPDLRIDPQRLAAGLEMANPAGHNLFAFPAQSNFTGVQHPLELIAQAQEKGWDVLVDAAAFVPTNRLDLKRWRPDFVAISFYKMFGYPTGIGCLLARKEAAQMKRPWYAGGTITISSVQGRGHYLADGEAAFEDGTVNYLGLPAIEVGLRHLEAVGMETIHKRVTCLAGWLLDQLQALRHHSGQPLVRVHGPGNLDMRGGTVTVTFYDPDGRPLDDRRIEELANREGISLRTGCFCNPGAGEVAHGLDERIMGDFFRSEQGMSFLELREALWERFGKSISAVRISVGIASNFADVHHFLTFAQGFLDRTVEEIGPVEGVAVPHGGWRDSA